MATIQHFFRALTGIRALAAWGVFLYHFNPLPQQTLFGGIFNQLHIGVDIFFVLSGFLICYRYYERYEMSRKWFAKYIVNRIARIYPMFFILTTLTFLIGFYFSYTNISTASYSLGSLIKNTLFNYGMNLTFLKSFFFDLRFSGIPQSWTLTVEECFYFSAPLIFLLIRRNYFWIQPITLFIIGILFIYIFRSFNFYGFFKNLEFMLSFTFFGRAFEFYLGILLGLVILKKRKMRLLENSILRSKMRGNHAILGLIGIITTIVIVSLGNGLWLTSIGRIFIIQLILPFYIFLLFHGLIVEEGVLTRLLSTNIMVLLGKSSFVFYLIHMGIIYDLTNFIFGGYLIISFLVLNIISIILYKYIEEPLNHKIKVNFISKISHASPN